MRTCRTTRPQLEVLESMTLLSALAHPLVHHGGSVQVSLPSSTATRVTLNGRLTGSYHLSGGVNADTGLDYVLSGTGDIRALGHVDVTGNMHSLGNIAKGRAQGL